MHECEIGEKSNALPRDISRFKRLYPNGRATIREDAEKTLAFLSTAELVANTAHT